MNKLNDANVPPKVAMEISGHKTMTTYTRYHIVRDEERRAAIGRTDAMIRARATSSSPQGQTSEPTTPEH